MNPLHLYEFLKHTDRRKIKKELERLYLLNNIINGKIVVEKSKENIFDLIEKIVEKKWENGIFFEIESEIPKKDGELLTDSKFMNIVLNEVIENSKTAIIKTGKILIKIKKRDFIKVEINDSGIGIPKKDIPYIFDPFYLTNFHQFKGHLGIGLTIVKGLFKYLGYKIEIESEIGKGTKVNLYLI